MSSVLIHRRALKEIDGLPTEDKQRILSTIREIASDPFGGDVKSIKNECVEPRLLADISNRTLSDESI